jgi:TPP-dependent indolepyruvate ferredoxin oxidoreductase alpha subunit
LKPAFTLAQALENQVRDVNRIVLPPASCLHEQEKVRQRWPAAVRYFRAHGLNATFPGDISELGIITRGGMCNGVVRALQGLGLADVWGATRIPVHVLNVTYLLVDDDLAAFCAGKRALSVMGDGGFWHSRLVSFVGNAVYIRHDSVTVIVDNHYSAATGGQDLLSSRAEPKGRGTNHPIETAIRGIGASWVRRIDRTYDVAKLRDTLRVAPTSKEAGPKLVIASSECMLNRQRRERPLFAVAVRKGERMVKPRFGVDEHVCPGDHACIRL